MSKSNKTLLSLDPEYRSPWRAPVPGESVMLVLYARPPEHPSHFVLRAWYLGGKQTARARASLLFDTPEDASGYVARAFPHAVFMGAAIEDEPIVVGVWL